MGLSYERVIEVWDDNGDHFEVGEDRDGLGMIEIRCYQSDSDKVVTRLAFTREQATLLMIALEEIESFLIEKNGRTL